MEFMGSGSLEKMPPTQSLSRQLKFHITPETSLTMSFLHSIKPPLLYRDLKPGNLLPDSNMQGKGLVDLPAPFPRQTL